MSEYAEEKEQELSDLMRKPQIDLKLSFAQVTIILQGLRLLPDVLEDRASRLDQAGFTANQKDSALEFLAQSLEVIEALEPILMNAGEPIAQQAEKLINKAEREDAGYSDIAAMIVDG